MEKPATFKNKASQTLFGIIHSPDSGRKNEKRIGINILNPGLKNRVAPNRLNIKIARLLCEKGFYIFRFDPPGIGDSEGELPDLSVLDLWGDIQEKRFVEDTLCANEYFTNKCALDELILIGTCGGAITAFFTGVKDDRVKKMILIDMPVIISSSKRSFKDRIISSSETSKQALVGYLKKLIKPKSWINFLTGKSEYGAIWFLFKQKFGVPVNNEQSKTYDDINFNNLIPSALKKLISKKVRMSFILAEKDTNTQIFQDKFEKPYLRNSHKADKLSEVVIVENANHIYALKESQEVLFDYIFKALQ